MVADYKFVLRRQFQIPLEDMTFDEILFGAILYDQWVQKAPERARLAEEEARQFEIELRLINRLVRGEALPSLPAANP